MSKVPSGTEGTVKTLLTSLDDLDKPLTWTLKTVDDGFKKTEYWEAKGSDGKTYTITVSEPATEKTGTITKT
jgi:hypothetical protein